MSPLSPIISLNDVQFTWPDAKAPTVHIASFSVNQGEHIFIKGPSGCGKSTLLSLLTGINTVTSGQLKVLGDDLKDLKPSLRDKFRAEHLGYIFQQFNLLPYLNVLENVLLPTQFSKQRKQNCHDPLQQAKHLLTRLRLPQEYHLMPITDLSIGQQQRVAAARALIGQPKLVIADEPTSALDHDTRKAFIELLMEEVDQAGSTLIFVSHDPSLEPLFKRTVSLPEINLAARKSEDLS